MINMAVVFRTWQSFDIKISGHLSTPGTGGGNYLLAAEECEDGDDVPWEATHQQQSSIFCKCWNDYDWLIYEFCSTSMVRQNIRHWPEKSRSKQMQSWASSRGSPKQTKTSYFVYEVESTSYTWNSCVDKNTLQSDVTLIKSEVIFSALLGSINKLSKSVEFILYFSLQSKFSSDRKLIYHLYQ